MKKVLYTFFVIMLGCILSITAFAGGLTGDVNGDGRITASDARTVLRHAASLSKIADEYLDAADVNNDGRITAADARRVLRVAANLEKFDDTPVNPPADNPDGPLTAVEVHKIASKYTVEVTATDDQYMSTGSGFFITDDGQVVTNYHVIEGMWEITVTDYSGNEYPVEHVLAYSADMDIAVLKVNTVSEYAQLNYDVPLTGSVSYTLGSSKGMTDTFSNGIISNGSRVVADYHPTMTYIQTTAPISNGNSGGPLINDRAEVIGINSWHITDAQNLNFAIPVKYINDLDYSNPLTMSEFAELSSGGSSSDDPSTPSTPSGDSLSVGMDRMYLDKGGSAAIYVELLDDNFDSVIVEYDTSVFHCEWEENDYEYTDSGNLVYVLYVSALEYISYTDYLTIYFEGYKEETSVNIAVTVTEDGWYDYGGFPGAVDYGAYSRVAPYFYYMSEDGDYIAFSYDLNDLYNAGYDAEDILNDFFDYMEYYGYECVDYTDDSDSSTYTFYCEEYNLLYTYSLYKDDYGDYYCVTIMFETDY